MGRDWMGRFLRPAAILSSAVLVTFALISRDRPLADFEARLAARNIMPALWVKMALWPLTKSFHHTYNLLSGLRDLEPADLWQILPSTVFFVALAIHYSFRDRSSSGTPRWLAACEVALIVAAAFAPLSLLFVAWDVGRILSFSNFHAFGIFLILGRAWRRERPMAPRAVKMILWAAILLITAINLIRADTLPLMFRGEDLAFYPGFLR